MLAPCGQGPSGSLIPFSDQRNFPIARASRRMDPAMIDSRSYLAVVPAYNEEGTVAHVVRTIQDAAPDFDVLVVDDGSTDYTAERAEEAGARVLRHPFNLGIGGAVQSGFSYARERGHQREGPGRGGGQHA